MVKNVLGGVLQTCCTDPLTGFYRDGKCNSGVDDLGRVGYLLYETRGLTTVIGADGEPGPLMRDGLIAAGYRDGAGHV